LEFAAAWPAALARRLTISDTDGSVSADPTRPLTRGARTDALRYCDFDCSVQFLPTGNAVCVFAGGIRERR
jgi:hypothetical protein